MQKCGCFVVIAENLQIEISNLLDLMDFTKEMDMRCIGGFLRRIDRRNIHCNGSNEHWMTIE